MRARLWGLVLAILGLAAGAPALAAGVAESTVSVGGVQAALLLPAHPHGGIILLAGGDGEIGVGPNGQIAREGNQLVRTRADYAERGFAVLVPDCCVDVAAAVQFMRSYGKVTLVGTRRPWRGRGGAAGPAGADLGLPERRLRRRRQRDQHPGLAGAAAADPDRASPA